MVSDSESTKLTACVLTCNNESYIERCLKSLNFAEEVLVIDSGSTDNTLSIAEKFTSRIIKRHWPGYAEQRKFAIESANGEWMLFIDSDEEVSQELANAIKNVMNADPGEVAGFKINRRAFYLNRWQRQWYPDSKISLFRRDKAIITGHDPHPEIEVNGEVKSIKGDILHYPYRDISEHMRKLNDLSSVAAESYVERGRSANLFLIILRTFGEFLKKYFIKGGIFDGQAGFIVSATSSFYVFTKYIKLWEKKQQKNKNI